MVHHLTAEARPWLGAVGWSQDATGNILRGISRRIADGEEYSAPSTTDDPAILPEIEDAAAVIGYRRKQSPS